MPKKPKMRRKRRIRKSKSYWDFGDVTKEMCFRAQREKQDADKLKRDADKKAAEEAAAAAAIKKAEDDRIRALESQRKAEANRKTKELEAMRRDEEKQKRKKLNELQQKEKEEKLKVEREAKEAKLAKEREQKALEKIERKYIAVFLVIFAKGCKQRRTQRSRT